MSHGAKVIMALVLAVVGASTGLLILNALFPDQAGSLVGATIWTVALGLPLGIGLWEIQGGNDGRS